MSYTPSSAMNILSPEDVRRARLAKKPIKFTILVCGQGNTGKKTFVNSLCSHLNSLKVNNNSPKIFFDENDEAIDLQSPEFDVSKLNSAMTASTHDVSNTQDLFSYNNFSIKTHHLNVAGENVAPISLDVVLTTGLGESINNSQYCSRILEYLEDQLRLVLEEDCRIKRNPKFQDNRVHVALYFISPTSHGLSPLDIKALQKLSKRANIIPIISKADCLTIRELTLNKKLIMDDIKKNGIKVFDFENNEEEVNNDNLTDGNDSENGSIFNKSLPFAVIGANGFNQSENFGKYLSRKTEWGIINIEDPEVCDFQLLKTILFGSHLQELKDITQQSIYENYRTEKLSIKNLYAELQTAEAR